eukprot:7532682-Pyramimonas_sp.AAC.2
MTSLATKGSRKPDTGISSTLSHSQSAWKVRAYARIGFLGNPSDGFYGKTIAVSIENFYAEVIP